MSNGADAHGVDAITKMGADAKLRSRIKRGAFKLYFSWPAVIHKTEERPRHNALMSNVADAHGAGAINKWALTPNRART